MLLPVSARCYYHAADGKRLGQNALFFWDPSFGHAQFSQLTQVFVGNLLQGAPVAHRQRRRECIWRNFREKRGTDLLSWAGVIHWKHVGLKCKRLRLRLGLTAHFNQSTILSRSGVMDCSTRRAKRRGKLLNGRGSGCSEQSRPSLTTRTR